MNFSQYLFSCVMIRKELHNMIKNNDPSIPIEEQIKWIIDIALTVKDYTSMTYY